ncbi:MAG: hypothetical protein KC731_24415 [Myxococcales bacterium]|nr:hypothetical protein [Myxococcales bacterium]
MTFVEFVEGASGLSLTAPQRVWAAVAIDRVDPRTLSPEDQETCRAIFGHASEIPELAREVVCLYKGARVGGTLLCSLAALITGMTVPVKLGPGEVLFCPLVAPDTRLARQALNYIKGAVANMGWPTVSTSTDAIVLRRDDGVDVAFQVLPASRAGTATRGRTVGACHLQEACFFRDESSGVVNDSEVYRSLVARVVRGGFTFIESTPWTETGLLWDLTQENYAHPRTALAAKCPTLLMRPDDERLRARVEAERERDPINAAREFDCKAIGESSSSYFNAASVEAGAVDRPLVLAPQPGTWLNGAIDVGLTRDSSALAITRWEGDVVRVVETLTLRPEKGRPLSPSRVAEEMAKVCKRHGVTQLLSDGHHFESMAEWLAEHGVKLFKVDVSREAKTKRHETLKHLLDLGRFEFSSREPHLARELKAITAKPVAGGGWSIEYPRDRTGHCDLAAAIVIAAASSHRAGQQGSPDDYAERSARWRDQLPVAFGGLPYPEQREHAAWMRHIRRHVRPTTSASAHAARLAAKDRQPTRITRDTNHE